MLDDMMTEEFAVSLPESITSLQEMPCEVECEVSPRFILLCPHVSTTYFPLTSFQLDL